MIISKKHNFIFFRSHKTGSTSLQFALSGICGPEDIITPLSSVDEPLRSTQAHGIVPQNFALKNPNISRALEKTRRLLRLRLSSPHDYWRKHMGPEIVSRRLGIEVFESFRKVIVIRSPFETTLSDYFWLNRKGSTPAQKRENYPEWDEAKFSAFLTDTKWREKLRRNEILYRETKKFKNFYYVTYEDLPWNLQSLSESLEIADNWITHFINTTAKSGVRPKDVLAADIYEKFPELAKVVKRLQPTIIKDFSYTHKSIV